MTSHQSRVSAEHSLRVRQVLQNATLSLIESGQVP